MPQKNRVVRAKLEAHGVDIDELRRWNDAALDPVQELGLSEEEEQAQADVSAIEGED